MSQAYYPASQDRQERLGKVILVTVSAVSGFLVLLGLIYAVGTHARSAAAIAAAGCYPGTGSEAAPCTTPAMLASQYNTLASPVNKQLGIDMAAYTASESSNLVAAEGSLTAEVTAEQTFGTGLAGIKFPTAIAPFATVLIQANQARVTLTAKQAGSATLAQMRSYDHQVQAATATVDTDIKALIKAIQAAIPAS